MRGAAITGFGCVTGYGVGIAVMWDGLLSGQPAARLRYGRTTGCAPAIEELATLVPRMGGLAASRTSILARIAALEAWRSAGFMDVDRSRCGLMINRNFPQHAMVSEYYETLWNRGPSAVSGFGFVNTIANTVLGQIALELQLRGPSVLVFGSSLFAAALDQIRAGGTDVMVVGAVDDLCEFVADLCDACALTVERRGQAVATPRAYGMPATGMRLGDGAAFLVLEHPEHAERRGATVLGELWGCGGTASIEGEGPLARSERDLRAAVEFALTDAGIDAADVGAAVTAASGIERYDDVESVALSAAHIGGVACAPKIALSETWSSALVLGTIIGALMLREGVVLPTPSFGATPLSLAKESRPLDARFAIAVGMEAGGGNDVVVLGSGP